MNSTFGLATLAALIIAIIFLFSPVAGYFADVKLGTFKALLFSTYLVVFSTIILIITVALTYLDHNVGFYFITTAVLYVIGQLLCCFGTMVYLANVLKFGYEMLQQSTQSSIYILHFGAVV